MSLPAFFSLEICTVKSTLPETFKQVPFICGFIEVHPLIAITPQLLRITSEHLSHSLDTSDIPIQINHKKVTFWAFINFTYIKYDK